MNTIRYTFDLLIELKNVLTGSAGVEFINFCGVDRSFSNTWQLQYYTSNELYVFFFFSGNFYSFEHGCSLIKHRDHFQAPVEILTILHGLLQQMELALVSYI